MWFSTRRRPHLERVALGDLFAHVGVAQIDGLEVLVEDVLALLGELGLAQQAVDVRRIEPEQAGHDAHGNHVLGQRELNLVLGDIGQRHGVRAVAIVLGRAELGRVIDQDAAVAQIVDRVS